MNRLLKLVLIGVAAALLVAPVTAQDELQNVIIDSTFGGTTIANLNVITSSTSTESDIQALIFAGFLGVDPETGQVAPNQPGTLVESWEVSEDGTVYTFQLKDHFVWSDGTPVTARDLQTFWDSIESGLVESPVAYLQDYIVDVQMLDDYSLQVTLVDASCEGVNNMFLDPFPSHLVTDADGNIDFQLVNELTFTDPETAIEIGPYQLSAYIPDQQVALIPVETWPEEEGPILNNGYILQNTESQAVQMEALLAGQVDLTDFVPPDRRQQIREAEHLETYEYVPGDSWDYLAVNLANPDNPQPGRDENGNEIVQDPHPIFADVRVRRAMAHAINMDDVIQGATFGEASQMQSMYAPGTWVYPENVPFYEYDPELAAQLLDEAGWRDEDGDGVRECHGCAYTEVDPAYEGSPFTFTLFTNQGNTRRTGFGQIVQDQLAAVGIDVDFRTIDFFTLTDLLDHQTFDAAILGWLNSYPYSPDRTQLFGIAGDTIGGSNFGSWHNHRFDDLMRQALFLPGCNLEERAALYAEAAQIFHEDAPYIAMFSVNGMYAWNDRLQGVDPFPRAMRWNLTEWTVSR